MRVISQHGNIDLPYEQIAVCHAMESVIALYNGNKYVLGEYSSKEKSYKAMEMLRIAYVGKFITNADIPDDFNKQLKELMKGGFGTVIVKDTNDSRVEFNNLNGYFQFPHDDEIEV